MAQAKQKVVLATTNKGKIRELAQELAVHGIEVVGLDQFPDFGEIEEYGQTFAEKKIIRAAYAFEQSGEGK